MAFQSDPVYGGFDFYPVNMRNEAAGRSNNGINMMKGYGMIVILSPEDVIMIMEKEND